MKQRMKTLVLIALVVLAAAVCMAVSDDDPVRLSTDMFTNPQRPGAVFDHDTHNELAGLEDDCGICHHVIEDGQVVEDETSEDTACGECHTDNLREVYHNRCKTCHYEQKKGPVLCGECHIR